MDEGAVVLSDRGFWLADGNFSTRDEAFEEACAVVSRRCGADGVDPLPVIGDFVIPPPDGPASRDYQTLHFDFGLPLVPMVAQDVAGYTALYIAHSAAGVSATTRLVPLAPLVRRRDWPERSELLARFAAYGRTHGAWDDSQGYVEGSLARVIKAAVAASPVLASVKADPDFLCGMEFDSLSAEVAFFWSHGLDIEEVAIEVALRPGSSWSLTTWRWLTVAGGAGSPVSYINGCSVIDNSVRLSSERRASVCSARSPGRRPTRQQPAGRWRAERNAPPIRTRAQLWLRGPSPPSGRC